MFDIIIPVYNTKVAYLKECLESVLNQTYTDWKCYIVNGTPNDSERYYDIHVYLQEMALRDGRFDYFLNEGEDTGVSAQRNIAITRGENPYIVLLDSDDWLEIDWLNTLSRNVSDKYSIYYGRLRATYIKEYNTMRETIIAEFNRYSMSPLIPAEYKGLFHSFIVLRTVGTCINRRDAECSGAISGNIFDENLGFVEDTHFFRKIHGGVGHDEGVRDSLYIPLIAGHIRMHEEQNTKGRGEWDVTPKRLLQLDEKFKKEWGVPDSSEVPEGVSAEFWEWMCDMVMHHRTPLTKVFIERSLVEIESKWNEYLTEEEDDSIYEEV